MLECSSKTEGKFNVLIDCLNTSLFYSYNTFLCFFEKDSVVFRRRLVILIISIAFFTAVVQEYVAASR